MPKGQTQWTGSAAQQAELIQLYRSGQSIHQLAKKYRCRTPVVSKVLADAKVILHAGGRLHPKLSPDQEKEVADQYIAGAALRSIAKQRNISVTTVRNVLRRQNISSNPASRPVFWTAERLEMLTQLHKEGSSVKQISVELGVSGSAVLRRLRALQLLEKPRPRGERHHKWKGGKALNGEGYVLVRCTEDDLSYTTPHVSGYALEHRVVLGKAIGRRLLRSETVHHIDGDRTNNDLSNLQLRQGNHGVGVVHRCRTCGSQDIEPVVLADPPSR